MVLSLETVVKQSGIWYAYVGRKTLTSIKKRSGHSTRCQRMIFSDGNTQATNDINSLNGFHQVLWYSKESIAVIEIFDVKRFS